MGNFVIGYNSNGNKELQFVGKTPSTDKERIALALEKWNIIREHPGILDGGVTTCAFCMKYIGDECIECPIKNFTGHEFCKETPYEEYYGAVHELEYAHNDREVTLYQDRAKTSSENEYQFLKKIEALILEEEANGNQTD